VLKRIYRSIDTLAVWRGKDIAFGQPLPFWFVPGLDDKPRMSARLPVLDSVEYLQVRSSTYSVGRLRDGAHDRSMQLLAVGKVVSHGSVFQV
jgi:hypothetical protein